MSESQSNNDLASAYDNKTYIESLIYLELSIRIKVIATLLVLAAGLVGHFLTILIFSQKRFRINSSNVYLLCLAINDGLYLVIYFFEETIIAIKDILSSEMAPSKLFDFIQMLNVIDKDELTCQIINYLRYVLRFTSAYIIVVFTIQRLFIVYRPLVNRFKSKKSAWITVLIILIVSLVLNGWSGFLFEIRLDGYYEHCAVKKDLSDLYFQMNTFYIMAIMLLPILVIFMLNFLIIIKTNQDDNNRRKLLQSDQANLIRTNRENHLMVKTLTLTPVVKTLSTAIGASGLTVNFDPLAQQQSLKRKQINQNKKKLTKMLLLTSFSYAFFNLPHLIFWLMYFRETNAIIRNHLFAGLQITEIFYMGNYGLHFYIYCISGTLFRSQLKNYSRPIKKKIQVNIK